MPFVADRIDDNLVRRVRAEFREVPGLRLTPDQAQRLWNLDSRTCDALISHLTQTRFLARGRDGRVFVLDGGR